MKTVRLDLFKYKIIEYEYKKLTSDGYELAKVIHKTNSKLLFYLIILTFKLDGIKYEVVK